MKTTVDLPDALVIRAKKRAAELRRPLRMLVIEGLRSSLAAHASGTRRGKGPARKIRWITVAGGLPPGVDIANREAMHDWLRRQS